MPVVLARGGVSYVAPTRFAACVVAKLELNVRIAIDASEMLKARMGFLQCLVRSMTRLTINEHSG